MTKIYFSVLLVLFMLPVIGHSQRLIEVIDQSEKAALIVTSHTSSGEIISEASGFIISSDGIAIIPGSLFFNSDSIIVKIHNGREYGIQQVLQIHPQSNLALVKIAASKNKEFNYLVPSKQTTKEKQDVLVLGNPADMEDGMLIASVASIKYQLFLNRISVLSKPMTKKSFGAPVVNNRGELVGIINAYTTETPALAISPNVINDTNWVNVNMPPRSIKFSDEIRLKLSSDYNQGLYSMAIGNFENSANSFSKYLKLEKDDAVVYSLRGHARYKYQNTFGCKEDLATSKRLDTQGFLPNYYDGLHLLDDNKKEEALINFSICTDKKPDFVYSLVEQGKLKQSLNRDLEGALNDFITAIRIDSTYGAAYYEKARFIMQYFDNKKPALSDINKAIDLDPDLPGVYSIRGTMLIDEQNYLAAIQDLNIAIAKDPVDLHAIFNRGVAEYNLGMKDKACADWEKAGSMGHYKAVKYLSRYCSGTNQK
jgi:tetratricopeptide (TPR) repeat protein